MALQLGQVTEQVKVNADAAVVSTTSADISGLVGEQQVKDLPLNGRSYDELMTLNPGVVNFTWEKDGRNRRIEFHDRQHVFRRGKQAAAKYVFAEWSGIYRRR